MKTSTQIKRALGFATPVVEEYFDPDQAHIVLSLMQANYQSLALKVPLFKSSFNEMTLRLAVDTLALYQALLTKMPQPEALSLIQPFVNNWMDGQFDRRIARTVYANPTLHLFYRRWWFNRVNRADESDGQKFEFLPLAGDLFYGVNVVRCGIAKFLSQMGAPEIIPFICQGDIHIQKYLPKGITFERTKTIGAGDSYCDFRYYRRNSRQRSPGRRK